MKEPVPLPTPSPATKKPPTDMSRNRYKIYVLTAILILAVYSLLTGTVTLKSSAETHTDTLPDIDILEVEEREKFVEQMWELYAHGGRIRMPIFWRAAFEAAYEELAGDESDARRAAISEIARMSMQKLLDLEPSRRSDANTGKEKHHQVGGRAKAKLSSMASA